MVEGPQVGVRGRRPHRPQLLPARLRGAPHPPGRGARARSAAIAARHDLILGNVFHAGDGNLHPLIVFDRRGPGRPGAGARRRPGDRRGVRGRRRQPLRRARDRPGEARRHAPGVLRGRPRGPEAGCARPSTRRAGATRRRSCRGRVPLRRHRRAARGGVGVTDAARVDDVRRRDGRRRVGPVRGASGGRTQWEVGGRPRRGTSARCVGPGRRGRPRAGRDDRPGRGRHDPRRAAGRRLAAAGRMSPWRPTSPRGPRSAGSWPSGHSGYRRLGLGPVRDAVLEVTAVTARGELIRAGAPLVKNVTGFDLCRLFVGSLGTLALLGRGGAALPARARRSRPGGWGRAPTRSRWPPRSTGRCRCCGTGPGPGSAWPATRPTWTDQAAAGPRAGVRAGATAAAGRRVPGAGRAARRLCGPAGGGRDRQRVAGRGRRRDWCTARADVAGPAGRRRPRPSPAVVGLHRALKERFDPDGRLNPGRCRLGRWRR